MPVYGLLDRRRERRVPFRDPLEIRADAQLLEELLVGEARRDLRPPARATMDLAKQLPGAGGGRKIDPAGKQIRLPIAQPRIDKLHAEAVLFRIDPENLRHRPLADKLGDRLQGFDLDGRAHRIGRPIGRDLQLRQRLLDYHLASDCFDDADVARNPAAEHALRDRRLVAGEMRRRAAQHAHNFLGAAPPQFQQRHRRKERDVRRDDHVGPTERRMLAARARLRRHRALPPRVFRHRDRARALRCRPALRGSHSPAAVSSGIPR